MVFKQTLKILAIAFFIDFIENLILLIFFGVKIGRSVLIGSGIFALVVVLLSKELVLNKKEIN